MLRVGCSRFPAFRSLNPQFKFTIFHPRFQPESLARSTSPDLDGEIIRNRCGARLCRRPAAITWPDITMSIFQVAWRYKYQSSPSHSSYFFAMSKTRTSSHPNWQRQPSRDQTSKARFHPLVPSVPCVLSSRHWMFDVGCWLLDVLVTHHASRFIHHPPPSSSRLTASTT